MVFHPINNLVFITFLLVSLASLVYLSHGQGTTTTKVGFYSKTCPRAESIVQSTIENHFKTNPTVAPGLLRMFFHDCFVNGCDASILINGSNTEKTAVPNLLLRGFDAIDEAKEKVEKVCHGVVSCADILAFAARDSVVLTGGATWLVPAGRRDGLISLASNTNNLPGPTDPVDVQIQKFKDKGLSIDDLVTLVGGHTIGTAACRFFSYRLYNYNSTGRPDPSISKNFLPTLQRLCPVNGNGAVRVDLDNGSGNKFDNDIFSKLKDGKGVLESDQRLWSNNLTSDVVKKYLVGARSGVLGLTFSDQFGKSMVKMSNVGVNTGGQIRKICSAVNKT